jgi:hypothetical protein
LIVSALLLLIFPLVQGRELDWPMWTFVMMAASVPFLLTFAWYERRKMAKDGSPLVVPSLFKSRAFVAGLGVNLVFEMALGAYFLIYTLMLQAGLGYKVLTAGLIGIPFSVGVGLSIGLLGNKLIPRLGRYLLSVGAVVMALGMLTTVWTIFHFGAGVHPWQFAPSLFITGLGMGTVMAPIFAVVLSGVDVKHAGSASGVLSAMQQVGGAVGVAVVGVIFFGLLGSQAGTSVDAATPKLRAELTAAHVPAVAQDGIVAGFKTCYDDRVHQKDSSKLPASCQQTTDPRVPAPMAEKIGVAMKAAAKDANERNFAHAFRTSIFCELILLAITFALSFALPRKVKEEALEMAS